MKQLNTDSPLWQTIDGIVRAEGLKLYDVDTPARANGTLRVYIFRNNAAQSEVSHEDCARVSKSISRSDEESAFIPDETILEVSSPGVNRRLRLPDHFSAAVGERIKLSGKRHESGKNFSLKGDLISYEKGIVQVRVEAGERTETARLDEIREARVDFKF